MTSLPKNIDHPCYHDDEAARIALEAIFWPYGPTCPKCGKLDTVSQYGKSMGPGWYWCTPCREKEVVPGFPDRLLPVDGTAATILKTRALTNLYNERPAWLANAHRDLDAAVAAAYGWPADLSEEEALARLLALNLDRSR